MNPTDEQPTNQTPDLNLPTTPVAPVAPEPPLPLTPQPSAPPAVPQGSDPGKVLAIVGLILGFVGLSLVGLILSIVAKMKSSKAGFKNTLAVVSIVLNSIFLILTPILLMIMLVAFSGVQSLAKDRATYSELAILNEGVNSYIQEKEGIPTSLSEVVAGTDIGVEESHLTDSEGRAYTLTWDPAGCNTLETCNSYTLSGGSFMHDGEKISITHNGVTGETTYVNKPTSSTSK